MAAEGNFMGAFKTICSFDAGKANAVLTKSAIEKKWMNPIVQVSYQENADRAEIQP